MRFIDEPPQSRSEALASFVRWIKLCEERGKIKTAEGKAKIEQLSGRLGLHAMILTGIAFAFLPWILRRRVYQPRSNKPYACDDFQRRVTGDFERLIKGMG